MKFAVKIVHISNKILFDDAAESVFFPSVYGETQVAPLHAPITALMSEGEITVQRENEAAVTISIGQGLVRFDGENLFAVVE
jgi:F0F1-type ATP synthase epsilon subunit